MTASPLLAYSPELILNSVIYLSSCRFSSVFDWELNHYRFCFFLARNLYLFVPHLWIIIKTCNVQYGVKEVSIRVYVDVWHNMMNCVNYTRNKVRCRTHPRLILAQPIR